MWRGEWQLQIFIMSSRVASTLTTTFTCVWYIVSLIVVVVVVLVVLVALFVVAAVAVAVVRMCALLSYVLGGATTAIAKRQQASATRHVCVI